MDTDCLWAIGFFASLIGGILGLGWLVLQPMGPILRMRATGVRFVLSDFFWLVLLLQPSLAIVAAESRMRRPFFGGSLIPILIVIWIGTIIAWGTMTSILAKAGVHHQGKRAAAQLVILPVIGAIIPIAVVAQVLAVFALLAEYRTSWEITGAWSVFLVFDPLVALTIVGCRRLARWIAAGIITTAPATDATD